MHIEVCVETLNERPNSMLDVPKDDNGGESFVSSKETDALKNEYMVLLDGGMLPFGNLYSVHCWEPNEININMIARVLSRIPRFGGHTTEVSSYGYSVAQHSVHVAELVPDDLKVYALLHDAPEAFLGDMILPLQRFLSSIIPDFKSHWNKLHAVAQTRIDEYFIGKDAQVIRALHHDTIHAADMIMLRTERDQLLEAGDGTAFWPVIDEQPVRIVHPKKLEVWNPEVACRAFEQMYHKYLAYTPLLTDIQLFGGEKE